MKPMALNMSKVKKIASDKTSSTFEHEDGHTIKILHKALPAIQRRQIEKMPMCEGGKIKLAEGGVLPKYIHPPKNPKMEAVGIGGVAMAEGGEAKKPAPKKPAIRPDKGFGKTIVYPHSEEMQHFDQGGTIVAKPTGDTQAPPVQDSSPYDQTLSNGWSNIKKAFSGNSKAEGGEIEGKDEELARLRKENDELHKKFMEAHETMMKKSEPKKMAEGGKVQHYAQGTDSVQPATPAPGAEPDSTPPPQPQVDPAHVVSGQSPEQIASQIANQQTPAVQSAQPTNTGQSMYGDKTLNPSANLDLENKAVSQQAEVDKAKGAALANAQDGYGKALAANAQRDRDNLNQMTQHVKEFDTYNKEHPIDPTHYVSDMGAAKKTGTAIALLLGGIGSGLVGGSNPAQDFLDRQIDRDIEGQKARADQQKTIYGAYMKLYNDQNIASDLTKASLLGIQTNQINKISSQLATPQANAIAAAQTAKNNAAAQQALLDAAGRRNTLGTGGSGPANLNQQPGGKTPGSVASPTPAPAVKGGPPGQAGAQNSAEDEESKYANSPILAPGAERKLKNLAYTPKANDPAELAEIKSAYGNAYAADKLLSQLHGVHQSLYNDSKEGGTAGYIRRHDPIEDLPYVGKTLHGLVAQPATDNQTNRDYETNKTRLVSDIANSLKGTNVSGEEINHIVNANAPEHGDSPGQVAKKERAIRVFIKNATLKDQAILKKWDLAQ